MQSVEFADQAVVVTGAGGGLGRMLVSHFSAHGANLTACDQSEEALGHMPEASGVVFDLLDRHAAASAAL